MRNAIINYRVLAEVRSSKLIQLYEEIECNAYNEQYDFYFAGSYFSITPLLTIPSHRPYK